MKVVTIGFICSLLCLTACSPRQAYEGLRYHATQSCLDVPPGQYEQCMQQYGDDYDAYMDKRAVATENLH